MKLRKQNEGPFDDSFDPPYTSIHCGVVNGGEACNIVPKHCSFQAEWRNVPADTPGDIFNELQEFAKELEVEMQKVVSHTGISLQIDSESPALDTSVDSQVVKLGHEFSGTSDLLCVSYMTEAGLFHEAGVPTIIIGPGSIEQAHKPNEFVHIEQLEKCEGFVANVLKYVST